jgi:hypothetical protein
MDRASSARIANFQLDNYEVTMPVASKDVDEALRPRIIRKLELGVYER